MSIESSSSVAQPGKMSGPTYPTADWEMPDNLMDYIGPLPVLPWENICHFLSLVYDVAAAARPADYIEWLWVNDIVVLAWTVRRARHAISANISMARHRAIVEVLDAGSAGAGHDDGQLAKPAHGVVAYQIMSGHAESIQQLDTSLEGLGLGFRGDADRHLAFIAGLETTERLEAMINKAMRERDRLISRLERRQDEASHRKLAALQRFDALAHGEVQ